MSSGTGGANTASGNDDIFVIGQRIRRSPVIPVTANSNPAQAAPESNLHLAGFRKGERNWTSKRSGTPNKYKGLRPSKTKKGWVKYKDQNGKWVERPATEDELQYFATRGWSAYDYIGPFIPVPIALGMCLLAPSTCGVIDTNHNGVIDIDEIY